MSILFKQDWINYPTAIVDYNTTNESFKRLVYLYKQMGVKNAEFILALYQPDLVGVDPHDPNLSQELKFKVSLETRYNPWYFFREVALIPPNAGTTPIRFKANRGNIAMYWSFFNHVDFGLLQPRQTGKSVSTDILMTGLHDAWASNTTISLVTKDSALRNSNVERLKEIRALLPDYIYYPNKLDADNSELLTNHKLGNRYKTSVGRSDRVAADKLGRGLTVPIIHFDELAYISHIESSLPVALSSGAAARDEAQDANQPYGNIYTTTAGKINSRDGGYAYRFLTGGAIWDESYYDLEDQQSYANVVDRNSAGKKPLIYGAFNHRQLGKSDEWLYQKLRESASEGELADRDYLNVWTTGNEGSPLSPEEKATVKASERDVRYMEITPDSYTLRWYISEAEIDSRMADGKYIMGLDPSDALGGDNDAKGLVILDAYTHDVVAAGRYNETNITRFSIWLAKLIIKYPNLTFIPERKSSGVAMLDTITIQLSMAGIDPFKRIYNRIVDDPEAHKTDFQEIQRPLGSRPSYFYDRFKRHFGYNTSGAGANSRDALYGEALKSAMRLGGSRVYDKTLIGELLALAIKNGRVDHTSENHDDMVVAFLLTHWFCTKAKRLDYYGIDASKVFSANDTVKEAKTPEDFYRQTMQARYMNEFNQVMEELKDAQDPMIITKMEMRLRQISKRVDVQETTGHSIDAMIKQAQETRGRDRKINRYNAPTQARYGGMRPFNSHV